MRARQLPSPGQPFHPATETRRSNSGARNILADREKAKQMDRKIRSRVNQGLKKWGIVTLVEND